MNPLLPSKVAVLALFRNKTRAVLTALGIVVGIAAVVAVLAIGKGASKMMEREISAMGSNLVMVFPDWNRAGKVRGGMGAGQTLTAADAEAIENELGHLVRFASPAIIGPIQVIRGNRNWYCQAQGVSSDTAEIRNWPVERGCFFSREEQNDLARTCVIGTTVQKNLFDPDEDPVGQVIRCGPIPIRVAGVLQPKGANGWGQDQDDVIMLPWTTVSHVVTRSKFCAVGLLYLSLVSMDYLDEAKAEIAALLRQRHRLEDWEDDDFELRDTREILETVGSVSNLMTALLAAVAAISLLVGGIGIMNIMLVSVTERIREIGLRMALGATPFAILAQFVVEAVVLSVIGGALGAALGVFAANMIGEINRWPIEIETASVVAAFLFSSLVGLFFGFYPAYRASKLNPIDCLRHE